MLFVFLLILCHIAYCDVTERRIPNISVLMVYIFGGLSFFLNNFFLSISLIEAVSASFLVFLFFLFFYALGIMGAGDVKLGAALGFCFGMHIFFMIWVISILFLFIIESLIFIFKKFGYVLVENDAIRVNRKYMPYGAYLSSGALIYLIGIV